ncbi:hypothetical protein DFJ43DRAFT_993883 [Lentinula guzmanii]|uniref:Uncharacterized protein n=1 Tax=Lentinula guzmanii TaxID=2804957 RepID=A0AA38JKA9_9AGAR|nr:hypothetical protein DFJ43DRAFT_993883 [Lentinula guzmanii]
MSNPQLFPGENSTDPTVLDVEGYALCVFSAEGQNPDMQGYAVRLSNFIVNVCLALLIRYSEEDVAESVSVLLLQVYTLLVCAFVSLIRKQLSIADAHFALTSTVSPLALYLLYASVRKALRKSSYLFRRLDDHGTYSTLSLLMIPMWIIMNLLIYFTDLFSNTCPPITFASWMLFEGGAKAQHWKRFTWLQWLPLALKSFILAQWDVITKSHPWILTLSICTTYVIWGSSLILYVTDLGEFYYDLISGIQSENGIAVSPYTPPPGYDPLGYGQVKYSIHSIDFATNYESKVARRRCCLPTSLASLGHDLGKPEETASLDQRISRFTLEWYCVHFHRSSKSLGKGACKKS